MLILHRGNNVRLKCWEKQAGTKQTWQLRDPENAHIMSPCFNHLFNLHQGNFEAIFLVDQSAYKFCSFEAFNRNSSVVPQLVQILIPSFEQDKTEKWNQLNISSDCQSREERFPIDPEGAVIGEEVSLLHLFSQGKGVSIFSQLYCRLLSWGKDSYNVLLSISAGVQFHLNLIGR